MWQLLHIEYQTYINKYIYPIYVYVMYNIPHKSPYMYKIYNVLSIYYIHTDTQYLLLCINVEFIQYLQLYERYIPTKYGVYI